jgi:hypothetical protein
MRDDMLARLQRLEDEHAIAKLIASYGPLVDAGNADNAARLWAVDGNYDVEDWQMVGRAGVHEMVSSSSHQALVANGCCHFLGPAVVTVTGDSAVAVCESLVLLREHDRAAGYQVWRATANHFVLARTHGQWQITTRTSRMLNGDWYAHALLTAGLAGVAAPAPAPGAS